MQLEKVAKINISLNRALDTQKRENVYFYYGKTSRTVK